MDGVCQLWAESCRYNISIFFNLWRHKFPSSSTPMTRWFSTRLYYLWCVSNGDTAFLHLAIRLYTEPLVHDACVYTKFNHPISIYFSILALFGRRVVFVTSICLSICPSFRLTVSINLSNESTKLTKWLQYGLTADGIAFGEYWPISPCSLLALHVLAPDEFIN